MKKMQISKTSIMDMIDFMMVQTGINREQATIAFDTIVHYIRKHPAEPLNKLTGFLFGNEKDSRNSSLN